MAGNVIVAGARTPMGRLLGSLKSLSAAQLGGVAIAGALQRSGVSPDQVDYVIMGHKHESRVDEFGSGTYINLGHWLSLPATYAQFDGEKVELRTFTTEKATE